MAVRLNNNRIVRARADGSVELVDDGRYLIPPVGLQIGADCRAYRDANGNVVLEAATGKRILVPAEGVQVGADCRAYRDANGNVVLEAATGKRILVPAEGVQVGADCRAYRDSNGNVVLEAATGKRVLVPAEGVQVGADCRAYRSANGDLTFGDLTTYQDVVLKDLAVRRSLHPSISTDFFTLADQSWAGSAIGAGSVSQIAGSANHPGQRRLRSAAATNTGYCYQGISPSYTLVSAPGDLLISIFQLTNALGLNYIGDWNGTWFPTSGNWLEIAALIATGRTNNGGGSSNATGTTYTLTQGVWYRAEVETAPAGSIAYFRIYTCSDGALVWNDSVTPNHGNALNVFPVFCGVSNAAGATDLLDIDFVSWENNVVSR